MLQRTPFINPQEKLPLETHALACGVKRLYFNSACFTDFRHQVLQLLGSYFPVMFPARHDSEDLARHGGHGTTFFFGTERKDPARNVLARHGTARKSSHSHKYSTYMGV